MVKRALICLADGAEEMETVITADVLVRGGVEVVLAGVNGLQPALCSRNVKIVPDVSLDQVLNETFDAIIIPGGLKGANTCAENENVGNLLRKHYEDKKLVAAICAGPTALLTHKIGYGKNLTSYPSFKEKLNANFNYKEESVVQDENLITSRGPGTTFAFALKIVEYLEGAEKAQSLIDPMLLKF